MTLPCQAQRKAATEAEKQTKEEMKVLKNHPSALKLVLQAEVENEEVSMFQFKVVLILCSLGITDLDNEHWCCLIKKSEKL